MVVATLLRLVHELWEWLMQWFRKRTGTIVTFDTGKRVVVGRKIAEGGFSFVFAAMDADLSHGNGNGSGNGRRSTSLQHPNERRNERHQQKQVHYALKRVHCPDSDLLDACRREAAVHRAIHPHHPHVMPLLGLAFPADYCYMLFPYCAQSLREVVNQRHPFLRHGHFQATGTTSNTGIPNATAAPWTEPVALQLFGQICAGVQALHQHDYSHRDIKLENILLWSHDPKTAPSPHQATPQHDFHPLLMDFGSAGPCTVPVHSRREELALVEEAASHTTLPYRPPELFDGGVRWGIDERLDYRTVDVWSLGCTLHALLYGASPFECDFPHPGGGGGGGGSGGHGPYRTGMSAPTPGFRIVECTHLAILGHIPTPSHAPISNWYSNEIRVRLMEPMLNPDRHQRPTLDTVLTVIDDLLRSYGHESRWNSTIGTDTGTITLPWSDSNDHDSRLARVL